METRRFEGEEKMQALPCFEINPILLNDKKKYIYGVNRASGKLFFHMCSLGIEVAGFVDRECGRAFRKPIMTEQILENDVDILVLQKGDKVENGVYCDFPVVLNVKKTADIVIWGAGTIGRGLKQYLENCGINILFYVDSDERKEGTYVDNVKVYGKKKLHELSENTVLILAGKYWKIMQDYLVENDIHCERYYENGENILFYLKTNFLVVDAEEEVYISPNTMIALDEHYGDKKIILYGKDFRIANKTAKCLHMIGFDDVRVAYDNDISAEMRKNDTISIYDVLYEDEYIILLLDGQSEEKLLELGLVKKKDYVSMNGLDISNDRRMHFDLNLGYAYATGNELDLYPGMYIYGKQNNGYKIAVLGGSTTDGGSYDFDSWSEILYKKYLNTDVTIYNCGHSGYASGQELIKLMRDIVLLEPDMVLVYSGFNDVLQEREHTSAFEITYLEDTLKAMRPYFANKLEKEVVWGRKNNQPAWAKWLKNIEYMNAVAELNAISFYAFVQPLLPSKMKYTEHEKVLVNSLKLMRTEEEFYKCRELRSEAKNMSDTHKYIYDLSHIFDEEDVYMDIGHVYERGNEIIADNVWEIIRGEIK